MSAVQFTQWNRAAVQRFLQMLASVSSLNRFADAVDWTTRESDRPTACLRPLPLELYFGPDKEDILEAMDVLLDGDVLPADVAVPRVAVGLQPPPSRAFTHQPVRAGLRGVP